MFKITIERGPGGKIAVLENAKKRLEAAKKLGDLVVINTAKDEEATNPVDRIYYFAAVDTGRKALVPRPEGEGADDQMLHYRESGSRWIITPSVGPHPPSRISDTAAPRVQATVNRITREFFAELEAVPDAQDIKNLRRRLKRAIISIYRNATLEKTDNYNVKADWYGQTGAVPLADSFKVMTLRWYKQRRYDQDEEEF